jgi:hypothetical protein
MARDNFGSHPDWSAPVQRKLERLSIPYSRMDLPERRERRLLIGTPTGILLELVFREGGTASTPSAYQEQKHAE